MEQNNNNNQREPLSFLERALLTISAGSVAIAGLEVYRDLSEGYEVMDNPTTLTSLGVGLASSFICAVYHAGRNHQRNRNN